jgi:predicted RNase H-like nuclease
MRIVGVDGCRDGWVAIAWDIGATLPQEALSVRIHASFADLVDAYGDAAIMGVDIPIGLHDAGCRVCDSKARTMLRRRHSCVFNAPAPGMLGAPTYSDALARSWALTGTGTTKQAYAIFPKVAEVNRVMTPELQRRVVEVHPEVSFCALAGKPMAYPKRTPIGYEERRQLLEAAMQLSLWSRKAAFKSARPAKPDDLLDAMIAAWTARRVAEGIAERLPAEPPVDRRGLRMEIVF